MNMYFKLGISILFLYFMSMPVTHAMEVAITLDDLPVHGNLPPGVTRSDVINHMIKILKKHHISGVYGMMNGKHIDKTNLPVLEKWIAEGHFLGNHTYSHIDLAKEEESRFIQDIVKNESYLQELMKYKNYKYFRYPYLAEGNTLSKRDQVRDYLFKNEYQIAEVTTDFFDYAWNNPYVRCLEKKDTQNIAWLKKSYLEHSLYALGISHELSQQLFKRDIKNILLLHVGLFNAIMLDDLLTAYEEKGVKFITLEEALKDDVYKINPNVAHERPYTFLNQIRLSRGLKNPELVDIYYQRFPEKKLEGLCNN